MEAAGDGATSRSIARPSGRARHLQEFTLADPYSLMRAKMSFTSGLMLESGSQKEWDARARRSKRLLRARAADDSETDSMGESDCKGILRKVVRRDKAVGRK